MSTIDEFLKTIYLGDRYIKQIILDGYHGRVSIQIDCISRIERGKEMWDFYADGDIEDGSLVFTGVSSYEMEPQGFLPNADVEVVSAKRVENEAGPAYVVKLYVCGVQNSPEGKVGYITIVATGVHLEDPQRPGVIIDE